MANKKQLLSQSVLGESTFIITKRKKQSLYVKINEPLVRSLGTAILIVFVCLHFFISYYILDLNYKRDNGYYLIKYLNYGFGKTTPYNISILFFVVGLILIIIAIIISRGLWRLPVFIFLFLYIFHFYLFFNNFSVLIVDLVFWSSLVLNSIVVIFYRK